MAPNEHAAAFRELSPSLGGALRLRTDASIAIAQTCRAEAGFGLVAASGLPIMWCGRRATSPLERMRVLPSLLAFASLVPASAVRSQCVQ